MTPAQQELAKEIHKKHTKLRRLTNPEKTKAQNKKYARTAYLKKQEGIILIKKNLANYQNLIPYVMCVRLNLQREV